MKNLKEYITESFEGQIDEDVKSSQFRLWKKTAKTIQEQAKIYDALARVAKEGKISVQNQNERRKAFNKFVSYLPFGDKTRNLDILAKYNIGDDESWGKIMFESHDEMKKNHIPDDWIKQWDETAAEKAYKRAKKNGEIPDKIEDDDYEPRDLVIYDRWNPETHTTYEFHGKRGKSTEHQVNMMRVEFHYDYDVKYYDCYPILAKNYYGNVDNLKNRVQVDFVDEDDIE